MAQDAVTGAPPMTMEARIDAKFANDRLWAITFVVALFVQRAHQETSALRTAVYEPFGRPGRLMRQAQLMRCTRCTE